MKTETATAPRTLPSLFQIEERLAVIDAMMAETGGEITPDIEAAFTAYLTQTEMDLCVKLDNYVALIRREMAIESVARLQSQQYASRASIAANVAKRAKFRLLEFITGRGWKTVTTATGIKLVAWGNGGAMPIKWKHETEERPLDLNDPAVKPFVRAVTTYEIDEDAVRAALDATHDGKLPFAEYVPRGTHLRIT